MARNAEVKLVKLRSFSSKKYSVSRVTKLQIYAQFIKQEFRIASKI